LEPRTRSAPLGVVVRQGSCFFGGGRSDPTGGVRAARVYTVGRISTRRTLSTPRRRPGACSLRVSRPLDGGWPRRQHPRPMDCSVRELFPDGGVGLSPSRGWG